MKKEQKIHTTPLQPDAQIPPIGLLHLFAMIREDEERSCAPANHARAVYPLASEILATVFDNDSGRARYKVLDRAEGAVFPDIDPTGDGAPEAAFYVGMATAYLLMTQINGGPR